MTRPLHSSRTEYAGRLSDWLRDHLKVESPAHFEQAFLHQANYLSEANVEDFCSLVFLECAEVQAAGESLDASALLRILGRVRKRMTRHWQQEPSVGSLEQAVEPGSNDPTLESVARADSWQYFWRNLQETLAQESPEDVLLFHLRYLESDQKVAKKARTLAEIAGILNLPLSTVSRRLNDLLQRISQKVEQPD